MGISLFDLAKPVEKNPATGGGINSQIILIQEEDIDWTTFPARDVDGVTISYDIQLLTGKFMHSFYMTQGTIKPVQKKLKGSNQDCGGYQITLEGFYPGLGKAIQKWITNFGVDFKGLVIIQNCSAGTKYLVGEACNLVTIESIDSTWGEEVDKEKGSKIIFTCKQSVPMAFYEGVVTFDPSSASWYSTVETFQVLIGPQEEDPSILKPGRSVLTSAGVLKTSCQNTGKGFFFVSMVNHFDKVLSYIQNILKYNNIL